MNSLYHLYATDNLDKARILTPVLTVDEDIREEQWEQRRMLQQLLSRYPQRELPEEAESVRRNQETRDGTDKAIRECLSKWFTGAKNRNGGGSRGYRYLMIFK
ncbi:hypothetical protein LSH36_29g07003 [Paralvinella palmiformis]|uniref:Uncharacterized protein n=1 Tax=Paralvinella palmiformis TaxID=53620 RepID=A0AAD9K986_9ANNE|nr:hypothetical protein LSH36_29g07003 [Paralvinella palmiformis]